jgi:hypothetical protein
MTMSRSILVAGAVAVAVAVLVVGLPAAADRKTTRDDTRSSDEQTDIRSITHDHGPSPRIMRHVIRFDGTPGSSVAGDVSLFFRFRNRAGETVRRELVVARNPGGGLYGAFVTPGGVVAGYSRAWVEEGSRLLVEFSVPALGRPRNDRYRWHVWSTLGVGEFEEPCAGEDAGPPVCKDRAPAEGSVLHRF